MEERGTDSAYISRIQALRNKHAVLSVRVDEEQRRLSTTDFYLKQLKKQKYLLKQEIEELRRAANSG